MKYPHTIQQIRQTVSWLLKEYGYEAKAKRLEYTEALCTAAATILGSFLLFPMHGCRTGDDLCVGKKKRKRKFDHPSD